jgi:pilus assembly protein Flp/PilA
MAPEGGGLGKETFMQWLINRTKNFLRSEDGPTATEYAVMLALIIIVALAGITLLGTKVNAIFTDVTSKLPS